MRLLSDLPAELLRQIVAYLELPAQLAFATTSHHFFEVATAVMHEEDARHANSFSLFWAVHHNQRSTALRALGSGAKVNSLGPKALKRYPFTRTHLHPPTQQHVTPLHMAVEAGLDDMVTLLLEHGADINAPAVKACSCHIYQDWDWGDNMRPPIEYPNPRWTPLHLAICQGKTSTALLLLEKGASTIVTGRHIFVTENHIANYRVTAMQSAAAVGSEEVIEALHLRYGDELDPNETGNHGATPLHYAAHCFHREAAGRAVHKLHAMGANLNEKDFYGNTPFVEACYVGNFAVALSLLRLGADHRVSRISEGLTMWESSDLLHHLAETQLYLRRGHGVTAEQRKPIGPDLCDLISALVAAGVNIEAPASLSRQGREGETPLLTAARSGNIPALLQLLQLGAKVDARNEAGQSALAIAARERHTNVLQILIKAGADINGPLVSNQGARPRHSLLLTAVNERATDLVNLLLASGAAVDYQVEAGDTALMGAVETGNWEITQILLEAGANPKIVNKTGEGTIDRALNSSSSSWVAIIATLLAQGVPVYAVPQNSSAHAKPEGTLELLVRRAIEANTPKSRSHPHFMSHRLMMYAKLRILLDLCDRKNVTRECAQTCLAMCRRKAKYAREPAMMLESFMDKQGWTGDVSDQAAEDPSLGDDSQEVLDMLENWLGPHDVEFWEARLPPEVCLVAALLLGQRTAFKNLLQQVCRRDPAFPGREIPFLKSRSTLLHLVAIKGGIDILAPFVKIGFEVDRVDRMAMTPLKLALLYNQTTVAFWLIAMGAIPTKPGVYSPPPEMPEHTSPQEYSVLSSLRLPAIVAALFADFEEGIYNVMRHAQNWSPFHIAIAGEKPTLLLGILAKIGPPPLPRGDSKTYLHLACRCKDPAILELLLDAGADPHGGLECPTQPLTMLLTELVYGSLKRTHVRSIIKMLLRLVSYDYSLTRPRPLFVQATATEMMRWSLINYRGSYDERTKLAVRLDHLFEVTAIPRDIRLRENIVHR